MICIVDEETMLVIKHEAYKRYQDRLLKGAKNKPLHLHASDCIGEFVVCESVGLDWFDGGLGEVEELIVKSRAKPWPGLPVANNEPADAVYALVTPAFDFTAGNGYVLRGWITGRRAREMEGPGVTYKEHSRIIACTRLWPAKTLHGWVWNFELPQGEQR